MVQSPVGEAVFALTKFDLHIDNFKKNSDLKPPEPGKP
jgi:hypothetical protein